VLTPRSYTEDFAAVPESVPRARAVVAEFARAAGARGEQLDSIRLATSEGVTNAIVHAYRDRTGAVQVSISHVGGELWLLISDDGVGLGTGSWRGGLGVGLALIAQLADEFELVRRSNGGTQLQMRFSLPATHTTGRVQPVDHHLAAMPPPDCRRDRTSAARVDTGRGLSGLPDLLHH
jgi:stage II sporulation protein AB (anti-sigma F factor)